MKEGRERSGRLKVSEKTADKIKDKLAGNSDVRQAALPVKAARKRARQGAKVRIDAKIGFDTDPRKDSNARSRKIGYDGHEAIQLTGDEMGRIQGAWATGDPDEYKSVLEEVISGAYGRQDGGVPGLRIDADNVTEILFDDPRRSNKRTKMTKITGKTRPTVGPRTAPQGLVKVSKYPECPSVG